MKSPSIFRHARNKAPSFPPCICHSRESGNPVRGKLRQESRIQKHGFTLIEMIVAMAIMISIMGFGLFLSLDYYRSYIFYYEKDLVVSLLQKARSQSLANIDQSWHGIRVEADKYYIFEGTDAIHDYNHRDTSKDIPPYEAGKTITLSYPREAVFDQLTGRATVAGGDLTLSDGVRSVIISINNEGRISYQKP